MRFANELAGLAAGRHVVGADVAGARRLRRVAVLREHQGALRRGVDQRGLVLRIDGGDGDPVHALGEQVVDDALLLGGGAVGGEPELGFDVRQLGVGLLHAAPGDRPEVGRVVGHERQLDASWRPLGVRAASGDDIPTATTASHTTMPPSAAVSLRRDLIGSCSSSHDNAIDCAPNAATPGEDPEKRTGGIRSAARRRRRRARWPARRISPPDHRHRAAAAAAGDPRAVQTGRRTLGPHQLHEAIGPGRPEPARAVAGVRLVHQLAESDAAGPRQATRAAAARNVSARWRS